jgi:predicted NBD/HSP70 family sugar kinase
VSVTRLAGSAKLLRAMNSSATLAHLLRSGRLTRAELRELTGLSKPTSSEMLRLLTEAGLAVVAGRTSGALGPTAAIYAPNADAAYVAALSVRDTTGEDRPGLAVALCDFRGEVRDRSERWIDFAEVSPGDAVAEAVLESCRRAEIDPRRVRHVQIGVAGAYDPTRDVIHHVDVPGWRGSGVLGAIRDRVAAALDGDDDVTVALENDVKLAAIAERHRGVAADVDSFVLLWLGYGIGLATDLGGGLLRGARGGAGEIGYVPLHPDAAAGPAEGRVEGRGEGRGEGPARPVGPLDLQDLIGGPAVLRLAAEVGITAHTSGEAITAAIADGHDGVVQALARRIAFVLATVVAVLDPPLVVLAGETGQAGGAMLRDAVVAAMSQPTSHSELATTNEDVHIAVTAVADDAVLLGGLDAGLHAVRESLISSLANPTLE